MKHRGDLRAVNGNREYCNKITEITGGAYAYVKESFPLVTSIGGDAYAHAENCFKALNYNLAVIDGIPCAIIRERVKDGIVIKNCLVPSFKDGVCTGDKFYIVSDGNHNAHGKTIEKALFDLELKKGTRDISEFKNLELDNAIIDQQNEIINLIAQENHNAAIRSPIVLTKGERLTARIAIEKAKIKHERNKI